MQLCFQNHSKPQTSQTEGTLGLVCGWIYVLSVASAQHVLNSRSIDGLKKKQISMENGPFTDDL